MPFTHCRRNTTKRLKDARSTNSSERKENKNRCSIKKPDGRRKKKLRGKRLRINDESKRFLSALVDFQIRWTNFLNYFRRRSDDDNISR